MIRINVEVLLIANIVIYQITCCRMLVNRLCDVIMSALPTLGIRSVEFYDEIKPFLMERTDHFLKEFISFATSPHDISTYDR